MDWFWVGCVCFKWVGWKGCGGLDEWINANLKIQGLAPSILEYDFKNYKLIIVFCLLLFFERSQLLYDGRSR